MLQRFTEMYNYLRSVGLVHTQLDLANAIGSSDATISRAKQGDKRYLTTSLLRRINSCFGSIFNDDWLLTGEGDMLIGSGNNQQVHGNSNNSHNGNNRVSNITYNTTHNYASKNDCREIDKHSEELTDNNSLKVYYDTIATAGDAGNWAEDIANDPYFYLPLQQFAGCIAFKTKGESMFPTLRDGEYIVFKHKETSDMIINGEMYLAITRDGQRMVKRLVLEDKNEDGIHTILCISDNENKRLYRDFTVSGEDIVHIARIVGHIDIGEL